MKTHERTTDITREEKVSYKKDHRTHTGEDNRAMRRAWKNRKVRVNRKYRRKADAALHKAISPEQIDAAIRGDDGTTHELIRKGLMRERNRKTGVRSLEKALAELSDSRERSIERKVRHKERMIQQFKDNVRAFERNPELFREDEISWLAYQTRSTELRAFFKDNPSWISRLERKIDEVRKQRRIVAEKARIKVEEKWKWRSPSLRLPRNPKPGETDKV